MASAMTMGGRRRGLANLSATLLAISPCAGSELCDTSTAGTSASTGMGGSAPDRMAAAHAASTVSRTAVRTGRTGWDDELAGDGLGMAAIAYASEGCQTSSSRLTSSVSEPTWSTASGASGVIRPQGPRRSQTARIPAAAEGRTSLSGRSPT